MASNLPVVSTRHRLARAAISPSGAVLTGAGVAIGVLDHSVVVAVVLGVVGWGLRMSVAALRASLARHPLRTVTIDPWAVSEPWRDYVRQALAAEGRFDHVAATAASGPTQERLASLLPQVRHATEEIWALAQQGAALSTRPGSTSTESLSNEMRQVQAERARSAAGADRVASLARREEALAAQIHARRRAESAAASAADRLGILTARLDEAVTTLIEAVVAGRGVEETERVAGSVASLADEIESLRQGLLEAGGPTDASWPIPDELPVGPPTSLLDTPAQLAMPAPDPTVDPPEESAPPSSPARS
jgi:hypothetical protein